MSKREKEWRRVKTLPAMSEVVPFIMVNRSGAQIFVKDSIETDRLEKYMREKQQNGMPNLSLMHIFIAAYVKTVAQRPAIDRFIRGQRVWTRNNVEIALTIKKEMVLESPDTVVKIKLPKTATLKEVYESLNNAITSYRNDPGGDFDDTAKAFTRLPALLFKLAIHTLKCMDYFNLIPRSLQDLSPFHCSYFITSMGSLGIPAIYHHLYDFGTCPIFFAFGTKRRAYTLDAEGNLKKSSYVDFSFTLDERICDGYYYASALKYMKALLKNPWRLDEPSEVVPDIK